jgi:hypothetical protein
VAQTASPAPAEAGSQAEPPLESLVHLRYHHHRVRRNVRVLRRQESRLARYRFYVVLTVLIMLAAAFGVGSWHEIRHLFGI